MSAAAQISAISDAQFARVTEIAAAEAGLEIPSSKKSLVQSRIARRMRDLSISDCGAYLDALNGDPMERQLFISALTTNVSHFFREKHHFDFLETEFFSTSDPDRLRFWSAGCSNGQEPYSLAMHLLNSVPNARDKDILILATDIDPVVLKKAREGTYNASEMDGIPDGYRSRFLERVGDETWQVKAEVKKLLRFNRLNLNGDSWPMRGPFDAILCRNVVIYFNAETQAALWPRFRSLLKPGGILMLGHSERVHPIEGSGFEAVGVTTYRKTG